MTMHGIKRFLTGTTSRLAGTYLAIIMLMSVGFSIVFYQASSHQLGRQVPPPSFMSGVYGATGSGVIIQQNDRSDFDDFFVTRIREGRHDLLVRLIGLNLLALFLGAIISYYLARYTLQPIEEAMDAQTQFVSDASHELRTPLTALQAMNEVALRKPKLSTAEAKELLASNVEETVKLKNLTEGLLGLLRDNAAHDIRPVSLQEVASEAMNHIIAVASAKDIAVEDQTGKEWAYGNQPAMVQISTILLDNAIKYSAKKSTVFITSERVGKSALLHIRDEGIGIEPEELKHIFKRFYRADQSRSMQSGYGLGLSIAHKLVVQMGGTITVTSKPKHGSTFTLKLPAAEK